MDASPILARIARLLEEHGLEAIVVGNAAAALQGAPVTTVDIDFFYRRTPANLRKLTAIARDLDAILLRPHYPASGLMRIARDADGLQLDFMSQLDGIRSFEGVRRRAREVTFDGRALRVADLADIIRSKKAAARPQDLAALPVLEKTLAETQNHEARPPRRPQEGK
jgi:predicted nucleotidyltransferase